MHVSLWGAALPWGVSTDHHIDKRMRVPLASTRVSIHLRIIIAMRACVAADGHNDMRMRAHVAKA